MLLLLLLLLGAAPPALSRLGADAAASSSSSTAASALAAPPPALWLPAVLRASLPPLQPRRVYFARAGSELEAPEAAPEAGGGAAAGDEAAEGADAGADDQASPYRFPRLISSSQEAQHFDLALTNPGHAAAAAFEATGVAPLALLPYPPGVPSLAAYRAAETSATFKAMERWAAAWVTANAPALAFYPLHKDPLHAWSRRYEYVWAAEALRAGIAASPAHAQLAAVLEGTWPDAPAAPAPPGEAPFVALELAAQFTFFPQYLASRAGVAMRILEASEDFARNYEGAAALPLAGEPEASAARVQPTLGSAGGEGGVLAGMPAASIDAVLWVGKLDAVTADGDMRGLAAGLARVLRPGGRLYVTFNVGQPPIALDARQVKRVLGALREALVEDVSHGAAPELSGGGAARALFTNHKARPPEFLTSTFGISAHVFVKAPAAA
jgi:hypothetical protein